MSSDKLYTCTWKKTKSGFEIRSVDFPDVYGQGTTLFKAEEQFAFRLSDRVQQWPAAFGYMVPPPASEEHERFQSDWILIECGNAVLKQKGNLDHLFEGGACVECGAPFGPRTEEVLGFDYSSSSVEDVAYVKSGSVRMQIYSRQFVDSVLPGAMASFEIRPTKRRSGRCKKEYFELISSSILSPVVPSFCRELWRECSLCRRASVGGRFRIGELRYFFDVEDAIALGSEFALLGREVSGELVVGLEKWQRVPNLDSLIGVSTNRMGTLPKSMHLGHAANYQKTKEASPAG
jgi:hypothetical protein